ncbi:MAG: MFS transporter [Anaerovoracaceae bacterium]
MNKIKIGKYEIEKDLVIFLIISALMAVTLAADNTSLSNRLFDELDFTVMQRSMLETPRELPGLLTVILIGMLNSLGDVRIAAVANMFGGLGLILFGLAPSNFSIILVFLLMYSTGQHLYMPLANSIAMGFANNQSFGKRLGQIQGFGNFAIIAASGILFLLYKLINVSYGLVFTIAGGSMFLAGVLFLFMGKNQKKVVAKKKFIFDKKFATYYALATVNGARKQVTITFGPWLLIDIFGQPVTVITGLFFVVCILNIGFRPIYGHIIDNKGERFALQIEAVVMFVACIGFAFAKIAFSPTFALIIVGICYVMDKLMESAQMARATYVRRMSKNPAEVARTLSMGQSFDHVVSMTIPLLAGWVWYSNGANGYTCVFIGALFISALNFFIASKIPKKQPLR